jgi:putative FmdB family regulatory protein
MPTYDYKCNACDHRFEKFQPMTARPVRKCPDCGKLSAKRLIGTGAGVIFKGSGFYQTDYRNTSYNEAKKADKEPTADACGKCPHADKKSADKKPACAAKKSDKAKPSAN